MFSKPIFQYSGDSKRLRESLIIKLLVNGDSFIELNLVKYGVESTQEVFFGYINSILIEPNII